MQSSQKNFEKLRKDLENYQNWPSNYIFKFIIENKMDKKKELLSNFDLKSCNLTTKESSNKKYLSINKLQVNLLERGTVWLDTGTFQSLMQANQYVQVIEERQGRKIGCIEEAAFRMNLIDAEHLIKIAQPLLKSGYGQYLINLIKS